MVKTMHAISRTALLAVLGWVLAGAGWAAGVTVEQAYVRAVPPGQNVSAAYFIAENHSGEDRSIVGAQTEAADRAELHEHIHDKGVMRMRKVDRVFLPAGGRVVFEPGGYHVMLIGLKRALQPGDRVKLTLMLDDGTRITLHAPVQQPQPHGSAGAHAEHGVNH